jgi:hypothetical protein
MIAKTADSPVVSMIESMLDKIAEIEATKAGVLSAHPMLPRRRDVLMAEVAEIDQHLADLTMPFDSQIAGLKAAVAAEVVNLRASVKGSVYQAVYTKGRESVDTKLFKGLLLAHPEYQPMLRVGEPSVSIRPVKKGVVDNM